MHQPWRHRAGFQPDTSVLTLTVGSGVNHPVIAVDDNYAVSNASPADDFRVSAAAGVLANNTSLDGGLVALGIVVDGMVQTGAALESGAERCVWHRGDYLPGGHLAGAGAAAVGGDRVSMVLIGAGHGHC